MDKGTQQVMTLHRMEFGGFVVLKGRGTDDFGVAVGPVFAATSIDDALKFIRDAVNPVGGPQSPVAND